MEKFIKEITRQLEQHIITKDDADKILLNLFGVIDSSVADKVKSLFQLREFYYKQSHFSGWSEKNPNAIKCKEIELKLDEILKNCL